MTTCVEMETLTQREHFDRLRPQLERALEYDLHRHTIDDVWEMIESEHAQLWYGVNSVVVTQIKDFPQAKTFLIYLVAGNLEELEAMHPLIMEWGRLQDCKIVQAIGRKGWERTFLKQDGWKPVATVFQMSL